ncbi:MAG: S8 family serine peptidase [Kiritimatiellia bacterium]
MKQKLSLTLLGILLLIGGLFFAWTQRSRTVTATDRVTTPRTAASQPNLTVTTSLPPPSHKVLPTPLSPNALDPALHAATTSSAPTQEPPRTPPMTASPKTATPTGSGSFVISPVDVEGLRKSLRKSIDSLASNDTQNFRIRLEEHQDPVTMKQQLEAAGFRVHTVEGILFKCEGTRVQIESLLAHPFSGILSIGPDYVIHTYNSVARGAQFLNINAIQEGTTLDGRGELVAVIDSGLSTGDAATLHEDLRPALFGMVVEPGVSSMASTPEDLNGHGTHVAGSVVARGTTARGMASGALLFFQRIGNTADGNLIINNDLKNHFSRSSAVGASIISCSWGHFYPSNILGFYDTFALDIDDYVWEHPETFIVFAAGNDGVDNNKDNVIDSPTLYSLEAQAKNALIVGAQESYRNVTTIYSNFTMLNGKVGSLIGNDLVAKPSDGIHDGMAAFSSRGPTADGRIAPMLVAPGTAIYSTSKANASAFELMNGTSMATPIVAGSAALFRQYLREVQKIEHPTAALMRAGLILASHSLFPGQYGKGASLEIPESSPNNVEGWGALKLGAMLTGSAQLGFEDRIKLRKTGETKRIEIKNVQANTVLTVVLSSIDAPGVPPKMENSSFLINDYDLEIIAPDSTSKSVYDRFNPIERISITTVRAGTYTLVISAPRIAKDGIGNLAAVAWQAVTDTANPPLPRATSSNTNVTLTVISPDSVPYTYTDTSFFLSPIPGAHSYSKNTVLTVRGAPRLQKTAYGIEDSLCGWTLTCADGTVTQGTNTLFSLTLDQDATLRWHRKFPGFRFRLH